MRIHEILLEGGTLDAALRRGWVRVRYTRKDGMSRILMVTTNPKLYKYVFRRPPAQRRIYPNIITVWERDQGWRALYRKRIGAWEQA